MQRRARTVATLFALAVGAGALVAAACSGSYSGASEADAGDAAIDADAGPVDTCAHVGLPSPPSTDDAPGVSLPTFNVAFRSTVVDNGVNGFDLDGVCTCDPGPAAAHDGGDSCRRPAGTVASCDDDGGVDDELVNLFQTFGAFYPLATVTGQQIDKGRSNLVMQIAGYNGAANDPEVSVAMLASEGIKVQGCPNSTFETALSTWSPGWCGDDAWTITPESVIAGSAQTPVVVGRGFVRDRVLVVQLVGAPRLPFTDEYAVPLDSPIVVGTLVPLGEDMQPRDPSRAPQGKEARLWRITSGRIAGRIAAREMVTGIGSTKVDGDGGLVQLCNTASFPALKSILCKSVDVALKKANDFDPNAACDAVSAGIPFIADPVLIGDVYARNRKPGPCDPGANGEPLDASITYSCP